MLSAFPKMEIQLCLIGWDKITWNFTGHHQRGDRESCPAMPRAGNQHLDTMGSGACAKELGFLRMPLRYHEISLGQVLEKLSLGRFWLYLIQASCYRFIGGKSVVTP